jgi:putative membrane protein
MNERVLDDALKWLHVSGNLVWIGAIVAVGFLVATPISEPKTRGALALPIYTRLAVPAFVVSFVCGAVRLSMNVPYYLKEHHWMHPKLLFAVIAIGLHHVIGGRAKKLASGAVQDAGPAGIMTVVLALSAVAAAFFAIMRIPQ